MGRMSTKKKTLRRGAGKEGEENWVKVWMRRKFFRKTDSRSLLLSRLDRFGKSERKASKEAACVQSELAGHR